MTIKEIQNITNDGKILRYKTVLMKIQGIERKIELRFVGLNFVYALGDDGKWYPYHPKHVVQLFIL